MEQKICLTVIDKIQEIPNVVTLILKPETTISYQAGQFLTFLFNDNGEEFRRSYSLSSAPSVDQFLKITIKKVSNGRASKYLTDVVQIGDQLTALTPTGSFVLPHLDELEQVFLVGGGSGVTPLFGILKEILTTNPTTQVSFINANSHQNTIIFNNQLEDWARQYPKRLKIIHYISRPTIKPSSSIKNIIYKQGYLSNFVIEQIIQNHLITNPKKTHFYICGPEGVMLKARMTIKFMGFPKENIHREIFTIKSSFRPEASQLLDSIVTLEGEEKSISFDLKAGENILEAAERANINLPYSCKSGICTTCAMDCLSGTADMYTQERLFHSTHLQNMVFTCVGYPTTNKITLKNRLK